MVEILHYVFHAHAFGADEVGDGDVDVVEFDESCSCGRLAADFDAAHGDAGGVKEGNDKHGEP